jgi:hypothetical protein
MVSARDLNRRRVRQTIGRRTPARRAQLLPLGEIPFQSRGDEFLDAGEFSVPDEVVNFALDIRRRRVGGVSGKSYSYGHGYYLPAHQRLEVSAAMRDAKNEHVVACDRVNDDMAVYGKGPSAGGLNPHPGRAQRAGGWPAGRTAR